MHCRIEVLVSRENLGSVSICRECQQVHVTLGPFTIRLQVDTYLQFVNMVNSTLPAFQKGSVRKPARASCADSELVH